MSDKVEGEPKYTKTVHCFTNRSLRRHFEDVAEAAQYANDLLRAGHRVQLFDYKPPKRPVDFDVERGPEGWVRT